MSSPGRLSSTVPMTLMEVWSSVTMSRVSGSCRRILRAVGEDLVEHDGVVDGASQSSGWLQFCPRGPASSIRKAFTCRWKARKGRVCMAVGDRLIRELWTRSLLRNCGPAHAVHVAGMEQQQLSGCLHALRVRG